MVRRMKAVALVMKMWRRMVGGAKALNNARCHSWQFEINIHSLPKTSLWILLSWSVSFCRWRTWGTASLSYLIKVAQPLKVEPGCRVRRFGSKAHILSHCTQGANASESLRVVNLEENELIILLIRTIINYVKWANKQGRMGWEVRGQRTPSCHTCF